jgi:hypothetical protein
VAYDPSQAVPLSGSYFGASEDFLDMKVDIQVRSEEAADAHVPEAHAAAHLS